MKNWTQILVFVILSLILGFILGRVTGNKGHHPIMKKKMMRMGDGHESNGMRWHDKDSDVSMEFHGSDDIETVIEQFEESDFQGDTVIEIDGATINIERNGEEMKVEVKAEREGESSGEKKEIRIEKEVIID